MGEPVTVVEKVARALAKQHITRAHRQLYGIAPPSVVEHEVERTWRHHTEDARACLAALQTPTKAMVKAGTAVSIHGDGCAECLNAAEAQAVFTAMLTKALED